MLGACRRPVSTCLPSPAAWPLISVFVALQDMSDYGQMDWAYYAVGHQVSSRIEGSPRLGSFLKAVCNCHHFGINRLQLLETITSVAVVGLTLRKFTPLPKDFFRISLK